MNQSEHYIDVIITKEDEFFKATTPLFPKCKGVGTNEQDALLKLANSISNHVRRTTKKQMETLLLSKRFSEVIIDPAKKDTMQHKMFELGPESNSQKFNVFVKFSPFNSPPSKKVKAPLFTDVEEFLISKESLFQTPYFTTTKESSINLVTAETSLSLNEQED